jgi:hypothetical protein
MGKSNKIKIIMVMGVHRSGTNALFNSLAEDTNFRSFNESDDSEIFCEWNLRPESEIRSILQGSDPILLKPVSETEFRSVIDVIKEYESYEVWIPWIFRDPVNVYLSWFRKWNMPSVDEFIQMWNRRNQSILMALPDFGTRIGIVRYEDLVSDPQVFYRACGFFGIMGRYLFREDSQGGRRNLPVEIITKIERGTTQILNRLNKSRRFTPRRLSVSSLSIRLRRQLEKFNLLKGLRL